MASLSHHDVTMFFLAIGVLLGCARIAGEIAQYFRQPSVVGEILAGVLLGPTVFGALMPELQGAIFPSSGPVAIAINSVATLAIALFLLVAGMEIDLSAVWKQGRSVLLVGLIGIVAPFAVGFVPASAAPNWFGMGDAVSPWLFAFFFATAMSITALPVIAKILFDLRIFQTNLAVTIVSAAILNDLIGWIMFAFILALMGAGDATFSPGSTAVLTIIFAVLMLTIGRWWINRILPWIQAHTQWPAGVLAFALTGTLLCAALTEWIGVHAIFGAFLFGIALGDSGHLRRRTRTTIDQFVSFVFAPIFFASIGLKADFAANFDLGLVVVVLVIASAGKVIGCWIAARWAGFEKREAWAVGFGMNARGAMEIVLGLLALEAGLIDERLFVALVVMALVTSMAAGILIQRSFGRPQTVSFTKFVTPRTFTHELDGTTHLDAIRRLVTMASDEAGVDAGQAVESVLSREKVFSSATGNGVAIPHARIGGLAQPTVAVGISPEGIECDAPDGQPVHVIVAVLSPEDAPSTHLAILASVARTFVQPEAAQQMAATVTTLTELRAHLRVEESTSQSH